MGATAAAPVQVSLSLQVWPRSGRAAAAAWRSQRQPTEEFMALGISSKLLKIPFGIFQLKYMWSSASLCSCSCSCSFYSSSCHVQQTMQRHATLAMYKLLPSSLLQSPWKNAAECFLELFSLCSAQRRLCFNLCSMFWHFLNCIPPPLSLPSSLLQWVILCTDMLALAISQTCHYVCPG